MKRSVIVLVALAGCGQLAGIKELTSDETPDAGNVTPIEDAGTEAVTPDVVVDTTPAIDVTETDKGFRRVFVTSGAYLISVSGGVASADNRCQKAALENGLAANGEQWIAWLSAGTTRAIDRLPFADQYRLIDQDASVVVSKRDQLKENGILHAIDINEKGLPVEGNPDERRVWTGTEANGNIATDCAGWSVSGAFGTFGRAGEVDNTWTAAGTTACTVMLRLYCFEL